MDFNEINRGLAQKAKFIEKQVTLQDGSIINYGEGPENGFPLLLIHGQMVSWYDYAKVLQPLSKYFHIFAVDCYGHGGSSKDPKKYACAINGNDFIWFIQNIIRKPVFLSGHSSGGLLASWIAANANNDVLGLVIEDAPFFATEKNRCEKTYAWLDSFKTIHDFLNQKEYVNYTQYWLKHCYQRNFWGNGWEKFLLPKIDKYNRKHNTIIPYIWFLPEMANKGFYVTANLQDKTGNYDLLFGDMFYDCSWFENYDQTETLRKIKCPSVLLHTKWNYDKNGILLAAMDGNDAKKAHELISGNKLIDNIKSGHDIHNEKSKFFINTFINFLTMVDKI